MPAETALEWELLTTLLCAANGSGLMLTTAAPAVAAQVIIGNLSHHTMTGPAPSESLTGNEGDSESKPRNDKMTHKASVSSRLRRGDER